MESHVSAVSILSDTSMDRVMSLSYCCLQKMIMSQEMLKSFPEWIVMQCFGEDCGCHTSLIRMQHPYLLPSTHVWLIKHLKQIQTQWVLMVLKQK